MLKAKQIVYLQGIDVLDYVTKKLESNSNSIMETLKGQKEECQN